MWQVARGTSIFVNVFDCLTKSLPPRLFSTKAYIRKHKCRYLWLMRGFMRSCQRSTLEQDMCPRLPLEKITRSASRLQDTWSLQMEWLSGYISVPGRCGAGWRDSSNVLLTWWLRPHLLNLTPLKTTAPQQFELLFNFSMGGNGVWMLCRDRKGVLVLISAFLYEYDMFLIFVSARRCRLKRTFENLKIYMDRGQRNHLSFTSS